MITSAWISECENAGVRVHKRMLNSVTTLIDPRLHGGSTNPENVQISV